MLILLSASGFSWTMIAQKYWLLSWIRQADQNFKQRFNPDISLNKLYQTHVNQEGGGLLQLFLNAYEEYQYFLAKQENSGKAMLANISRAIEAKQEQIMLDLENNLSSLSTIGVISPFVGLFGTVWGIMSAFQALGQVQQASIAMVAPGIAEALVATAMGLFAAIPAVIAYNRFSSEITVFQSQYTVFQYELVNWFARHDNLNKG